MKRCVVILFSVTLLSGSGFSAQPAGGAASSATNSGKKNEWQNWVFAGGSLLAATAGLIAIALTGSGQVSHLH
jgi:ribose/xylose/arabinose/galactoside ABC-type transport system permease subunit